MNLSGNASIPNSHIANVKQENPPNRLNDIYNLIPNSKNQPNLEPN